MAGGAEEVIANGYVALSRLHGSLRFVDVVTALEELLVQLVGAGHWAIFLRDDESGWYERLVAGGSDGRALRSFALGEAPLGALVAAGEIAYGDPEAVVPLRSGLGETPVGAVVLVRLLEHKLSLLARDCALLELVRDHAGLAIEAALCAESGPPRCRVGTLRERCEARPPLAALALGRSS